MQAIHRLLSVPRERRDDLWLLEALQEAVEIEFSTVPLYLYAMWSLDDASLKGTAGSTMVSIVKQEMVHMGIAANILAGLGGRPLFINTGMQQEVIPVFPGKLKAGVHASLTAHLAPVSKALLLNTLMVIEEPDKIPAGAGGPDFKPTGEKTIGVFYDAISTQLGSLGASHALDVNRQIDLSSYFGNVAPTPFPTVAQAQQGIELILDQGEGAAGSPFGPDGKPAHFYQFASLYYEHQLTGTGAGPFSYTGTKVQFGVRANVPIDPKPAGSSDFDNDYSRMLDGIQTAWDAGSQGDLSVPIFTYMDNMGTKAIDLMNGQGGPSFTYNPVAQPRVPHEELALMAAAQPAPSYLQVQQALDRAINGMASIGAHGTFWRTLTRDEFVVKKIFGKQLVLVGDPANSNVVKALRGLTPFGSDTGTAGATLRRMPAGLPAMADADILLIENWIKQGCPLGPAAASAFQPLLFSFTTGAHFTPKQHNDYWRDFDNWSMFNAAPDVQDAIGVVFNLFPSWRDFAKDPAQEASFSTAIQGADIAPALRLLSSKQKATVERHYGNPAPLLALLDSYQQFGAGTLPDDPLRPVDPHHQMNGAALWFVWGAFVEAAVRTNVDVDFWRFLLRAILCGILNDGLERGRFTVQGFSKGQFEDVFTFVQQIAEPDLLPEVRRWYAQSGL